MKVVPKRKLKYPLALEREYAKKLAAYTAEQIEIVKRYVPEMEQLISAYAVRIDADDMLSVRLGVLLDKLERAMHKPTAMGNTIGTMFDRVAKDTDQRFNALVSSIFGTSFSVGAGNRVHADALDDDLERLRIIWVQENIELIKSIDSDTLNRIRGKLTDRIIDNSASTALTKYLNQAVSDIAGINKRRAALIGSDQIGKLNGRLMQYRQQSAGLSEYRWSSSGDQRVRARHRAYNGNIYQWDKPPEDGHPGQAIRCRCVAIPVIDLDKVPFKPLPGTYEPFKMDLQLFAKQPRNKIKQIILPKDEYAHVMSEINTNITKEELRRKVLSKPIGDYIYTFKIISFGNYVIYDKIPIEG